MPVATSSSGHRALLDAVVKPVCFASFNSGTKLFFEVQQVLVHAAFFWLRPTNPQTASTAEQRRRVERPQHEVVLLFSDSPDRREACCRNSRLRNADRFGVERRTHATRALPVERLAKIERVGDRVEHRFRRHIGFRRMKRGRQLDIAGAQLPGEVDPFFDRAIGIRIADLTWSQFLERRREYAHLHELRLERFGRHIGNRFLPAAWA